MYEDKGDSFAFEKSFCLRRSEIWPYEALRLFYSADVLETFDTLKCSHLFHPNDNLTELFPSNLTNCGSFSWSVQRMLWAYGFENVFKCIILTMYREKHPDATEVPFSEINSHRLVDLAKKAGLTLGEPQKFYLGILEKCAVWAGRYPLPLKDHQMYQKREGLPTREALSQRSRSRMQQYLRGEIPRIVAESDVLHSQMGGEEMQVCRELRNEATEKAEAVLGRSRCPQQS